jgi:hypothetical protein
MYLNFMMIGDRWAARHNISKPKRTPPTTLRLPAPTTPSATREETGK